jgi:hypothetical protein
MIDSYRKTIDGTVWHFCTNCTTYPEENYVSSQFPQRIGDAELCTECVARHAIGDCATDSDTGSLEKRKCPVLVGDKSCGLELIQDLATGVHMCALGHRTLIVPPTGGK